LVEEEEEEEEVTLRLTVSQSVSLGVEPHLGLMIRYLLLFDSYGLVFCGVLSLTRGRVCHLYKLLALASAVFVGSLGTREHILLSQDLRLPSRRLLRLAGSRWRYWTPPPYGFDLIASVSFLVTPRHGPSRKHRFQQYIVACVSIAVGTCLQSRYLETALQATITECIFRRSSVTGS
jgi:hypothetical protein